MIDQKNDKPASQGPQVTTQYRLADYNVLAAFNTMEDARGGITALGRDGIEAKHITLSGEAPDEAARNADTAASDARMMSRWFRISGEWAAAGAAVGAVLGVPIGIGLVAAIEQDITVASVALSIALGALFIGMIFGLVGSMYSLQAGDTWELTFQDSYGDKAIVGVHSADPKEIEKARDVLQKHGAVEVQVASSGQRPQDAVDSVARAAR